MWVVVVSSPPTAPQPGPVGQVARLSETAIAFAGTGRASTETAVAFAGAGRASTETGIAFAGENWVFLARFSLALVMVVSRWPVSVVVEVSLVSLSPPQCVLCAKKFSLHAQNTPKSAFLRLQGELFRGWGVKGGVLGELFRGWGVGGGVLGELFRAC